MRVSVSGAVKNKPDGAPLIRNIDLEIAPGEAVALVGRSGSGKSTLLAVLGLLDSFHTGTYLLEGHDVSALSERRRSAMRARHIGFVFQNFSLINHLTVAQNVAIALERRADLHHRAKRKLVMDALEILRIADLANRRPTKLSGGEKQRVAIARAIVGSPGLILADEPTGSLDVETGERVLGELLHATRERRASLLLVTHDMEHAARTDRTVVIQAGLVLTSAPELDQ